MQIEVYSLQKKGLKGLLLVIPGFEPHLYDWVMGSSNGLRLLLRTIKAAHKQGIPLSVEIPILRSNVYLLESTLRFLYQLKIHNILLRRITPQGASEKNFIALSPRLKLLSSLLSNALSRGHQLGMNIQVEGVPSCFFAPWSERQIVPRWLQAPRVSSKCSAGCFLPIDYISRFGSAEFACLRVKKQSVYTLDIDPAPNPNPEA